MYYVLGRFYTFSQATKTLREVRGIALLYFYAAAVEGGEG
jgi:hypothetical protein